MRFKTELIKKQFYSEVNPLMIAIVKDADHHASYNFGCGLLITRCTSKLKNGKESGVHQAGRGVDARYEFNGTLYYTETQAYELVYHTNVRYPRNDGRKTCILHSAKNKSGKSMPMHFHFQLAWNVSTYNKVTGQVV